jgi:hypothetical protein
MPYILEGVRIGTDVEPLPEPGTLFVIGRSGKIVYGNTIYVIKELVVEENERYWGTTTRLKMDMEVHGYATRRGGCITEIKPVEDRVLITPRWRPTPLLYVLSKIENCIFENSVQFKAQRVGTWSADAGATHVFSLGNKGATAVCGTRMDLLSSIHMLVRREEVTCRRCLKLLQND